MAIKQQQEEDCILMILILKKGNRRDLLIELFCILTMVVNTQTYTCEKLHTTKYTYK